MTDWEDYLKDCPEEQKEFVRTMLQKQKEYIKKEKEKRLARKGEEMATMEPDNHQGLTNKESLRKHLTDNAIEDMRENMTANKQYTININLEDAQDQMALHGTSLEKYISDCLDLLKNEIIQDIQGE